MDLLTYLAILNRAAARRPLPLWAWLAWFLGWPLIWLGAILWVLLRSKVKI